MAAREEGQNAVAECWCPCLNVWMETCLFPRFTNVGFVPHACPWLVGAELYILLSTVV